MSLAIAKEAPSSASTIVLRMNDEGGTLKRPNVQGKRRAATALGK